MTLLLRWESREVDRRVLYLVFIGSTGSLKYLCLIFGVVPSVASEVLKKMRILVVKMLKRNQHARVKFPDLTERREFARMINHRERMVSDCIGFVDGYLSQFILLKTPPNAAFASIKDFLAMESCITYYVLRITYVYLVVSSY